MREKGLAGLPFEKDTSSEAVAKNVFQMDPPLVFEPEIQYCPWSCK